MMSKPQIATKFYFMKFMLFFFIFNIILFILKHGLPYPLYVISISHVGHKG